MTNDHKFLNMDNHTQINNRHAQIKSIHKFISTSKEYLNDILGELGWSKEATYLKVSIWLVLKYF